MEANYIAMADEARRSASSLIDKIDSICHLAYTQDTMNGIMAISDLLLLRSDLYRRVPSRNLPTLHVPEHFAVAAMTANAYQRVGQMSTLDLATEIGPGRHQLQTRPGMGLHTTRGQVDSSYDLVFLIL